MSNRVKIFISILGIVFLLLVFYFLFFSPKNQQSTNQNENETTDTLFDTSENTKTTPETNSFPTLPEFSLPKKDDPSMTLSTVDGKNVVANNVYKNPIESLSNNAVAFVENEESHISFYPKNQGFLITIIDSNIEKARQKAESDFLSSLGITKEDACKLNVDLGMPAWVNDKAAGRNYGLSFCPNGKPFPKQ